MYSIDFTESGLGFGFVYILCMQEGNRRETEKEGGSEEK